MAKKSLPKLSIFCQTRKEIKEITPDLKSFCNLKIKNSSMNVDDYFKSLSHPTISKRIPVFITPTNELEFEYLVRALSNSGCGSFACCPSELMDHFCGLSPAITTSGYFVPSMMYQKGSSWLGLTLFVDDKQLMRLAKYYCRHNTTQFKHGASFSIVSADNLLLYHTPSNDDLPDVSYKNIDYIRDVSPCENSLKLNGVIIFSSEYVFEAKYCSKITEYYTKVRGFCTEQDLSLMPVVPIIQDDDAMQMQANLSQIKPVGDELSKTTLYQFYSHLKSDPKLVNNIFDKSLASGFLSKTPTEFD